MSRVKVRDFFKSLALSGALLTTSLPSAQDSYAQGVDAVQSIQQIKNAFRISIDAVKDAKPLIDITQKTIRGLDVNNQEPLVLGDTVNMVNADTLVLKSRSVHVPEFGDIFQGISKEDLASSDPVVSKEAYRQALSRQKELREVYKQKYDDLLAKRKESYDIYKAAAQASENGMALEKALEEINGSAPVSLVNAVNSKLVDAWFDMAVHLNNALALRQGEANYLVRRHDRALEIMKDVVAGQDVVEQQIQNIITAEQYYEAKNPTDKLEFGEKSMEDFMLGIKSKMDAATKLGVEADQIDVKSEQQATIENLITKMENTNSMAKAEAKRLLEEAIREDRRTAGIRRLAAVLNVAGSVASLSAGASDAGNPESGVQAKHTPLPPEPEFKYIKQSTTINGNTHTREVLILKTNDGMKPSSNEHLP